MSQDFIVRFIKGMEKAIFLFALPLAIFMSATESQYTPDHGFWPYFLILTLDTGLLVMKESFKSIKTKDLENFGESLPWYKAYSMVMMIQFFVAVISGVPYQSTIYYVMALLLFVARYSVYKRCLSEIK